ncbi:type IV secretion system protein [Alloyangia pacifica]|uniref:type IV secretion system protein n=1 Tax=Alloyangia pacifica TaxID=311180 RepID=UPI001CFE4E42|nr:type IV secretion system protein [Alloyangia pacifica]
MKRHALCAATLLALLAQPMHAQGVPVIDTTALANAKAEFAQQIAQMVRELEQAQALYASINGMTDMDSVVNALNSPEVRELLGPEAMQIARDFDVTIDDLGDLASTAQDAADFASLGGTDIDAEDFYRSELDRITNRSVRDTAIGERIVTLSDDRLEGLDQLRDKIGDVSTQREMDALSARIAVEQAMLQNDTNRIQGLAMLQDAQTRVEEQRQAEIAEERHARESEAFERLYGPDEF